MRFILSHAQGHKKAHKKQDLNLCAMPFSVKEFNPIKKILLLSLPFIAYNLHLSSSLPPCQSCDGFNWFQVTALSKPGVQNQHCLTLYCP